MELQKTGKSRFQLEKLEERIAPLLSTSVTVSSHETVPGQTVDPAPVSTGDPDPVTVSNTTIDPSNTTVDAPPNSTDPIVVTDIDKTQNVNV